MLDRILLILKIKNLSSSKFAEEIGVQRSGISHILSGRNKPSLEFMQKLLNRFSDINAEWLISGKGEMIKSEPGNKEMEVQTEINYRDNTKIADDLKNNKNYQTENTKETVRKNVQELLISEELEKKTKKQNLAISEENPNKSLSDNEIERIMIFYKNKTFVEYKPDGLN
jgi:transcriptional regulator with XRE-family HTH domain